MSGRLQELQETLRCLLPGSEGPPVSMQKFRQSIQELASRQLGASDLPSDGGATAGAVTGDHNYEFSFKLEGGTDLGLGVLVASAHSGKTRMPVPLRCKWQRQVGELLVELPGVTTNMYQISADDVGTDVCVEAAPADEDDDFQGVARGRLGPFDLDPGTRRNLDNMLSAGIAHFDVTEIKAPGADSLPRLLVLEASAEGVRLLPPEGEASEAVSAAFSLDDPRVIVHPLDTCTFSLALCGRTLTLAAASRSARDLIALVVRCLHAGRFLTAQQILDRLLPLGSEAPSGDGDLPGSPPPSGLGACIVIEALAKEVNAYVAQRESSKKALRNAHREKEQFQKQLLETITGFTEVIEGLQLQVQEGSAGTSAASAVSVERLKAQILDCQASSKVLESDLKVARRQLADARQARLAAEATSGGGPTATAEEVQSLTEQLHLLRARHGELASAPAAQQEVVDQSHMMELRRMRQDIETLHDDKETLRQQLKDSEVERQDLQKNFLYVQSQVDKVQARQDESQKSGELDGSKEFRTLQDSLAAVLEEKRRHTVRLEEFMRSMEKGKAYHEQSLDRITSVNGRIIEEKNKAEQELQRVSRLYADSVRQLQANAEASADAEDAQAPPPGASAAAAEVQTLRQQVRELDASISEKDAENEAVKNRIRKLASAVQQ